MSLPIAATSLPENHKFAILRIKDIKIKKENKKIDEKRISSELFILVNEINNFITGFSNKLFDFVRLERNGTIEARVNISTSPDTIISKTKLNICNFLLSEITCQNLLSPKVNKLNIFFLLIIYYFFYESF